LPKESSPYFLVTSSQGSSFKGTAALPLLSKKLDSPVNETLNKRKAEALKTSAPSLKKGLFSI